MSDRGPIIGYMYLARRACGRVSAAAWDDADHKKDTAKSVADWIKRGLAVERIERREGDPQPEWICHECRGKPCQNEPLRAAASIGESKND